MNKILYSIVPTRQVLLVNNKFSDTPLWGSQVFSCKSVLLCDHFRDNLNLIFLNDSGVVPHIFSNLLNLLWDKCIQPYLKYNKNPTRIRVGLNFLWEKFYSRLSSWSNSCQSVNDSLSLFFINQDRHCSLICWNCQTILIWVWNSYSCCCR